MPQMRRYYGGVLDMKPSNSCVFVRGQTRGFSDSIQGALSSTLHSALYSQFSTPEQYRAPKVWIGVSAPPLVGPGNRWCRARGPLRGRPAISLRLGRKGSNSAPAHLCCTRGISVNLTLERVRRQAVEEPASIRRFLETTAKELAIEAGCTHDVLARQKRLDRDPPYCLTKKVCKKVYYETSKDLGCSCAGNQVPAAPCMKAALQVFAGEGKDGLPPDLVKALCMY
ncbi:unnamed protein product [Scytosiphon promiscuus]